VTEAPASDWQSEWFPSLLFCAGALYSVFQPPFWGVKVVSLGTILLIVLVLCLIGAFPTWPHSAHWGYYPSSGLGLILIIVVVLVVLGRI
jgi:Protein of unknown function (DUF3309)